MTEIFAFSFLGMALLITLMNWRVGLSVTLLIGFLQDPLRKLVSGEPVYLSVLVGVFIAAAFIGAMAKRAPIQLFTLHQGDKRLSQPLLLFICWCLVSSLFAFARTGSATVAGIGLIAYLSPVPAVLLSIGYARNTAAVIAFMRRYLWLALPFVATIYLTFLGFDWELLNSVGPGLWIYPVTGGPAFKAPNGLFRAAEIAAWHSAAVACFLIILAHSRPNVVRKISAGVLLLALVGAILLTGRRKALMEIMIFVAAYGFLLVWFRRESARLAGSLLVISLTALVAMGYLGLFTDTPTERMESYTRRGMSVGGDSLSRLRSMTIDSFQWVIAQNGFLGSGAGTGSQGAQHFGAGASVVGGAAEGGLGKVLAELGVPGMLLLFWLGLAFFRHLWRLLRDIGKSDRQSASLACGLVAFLIANAAVFVAAHQVFGDVFVLLILGWSLGFVLSMSRNT